MPCALFGGGRRRPGRPVAPSEPDPSGVVGRIAVTPQSVSLQVGQSVPLVAVAYDSLTDTPMSGVAFAWASSAPGVVSVDAATGIATAAGPGTAQLTVTAVGAAQSASVPATVAAPAVASVALSPSSLSGNQGGSAVVAMTARDAQGNALSGKTFAVSSSDDTKATGVVAGASLTVSFVAAGSATLTVTCDGVQATLPVTVAAPSANYPNKPAGVTILSDRDFAAKVEGGWTDRGDANFEIVTPATDSMASQSNRLTSSTGRARYPAGFPGGSGPILTELAWAVGSRGKEIYLAINFAVSANWVGHPSGVNKQLFICCQNQAAGPPYTSIQGAGSGALSYQVRLQGVPSNVGGNNASGTQNIPIGVTVTRGQRTRVELRFVLNTVDGTGVANADGILQAWNEAGTLVLNRSNMAYRGLSPSGAASGVGGTELWASVKWNPTWGGTGGSIAAIQYQYMYDLAVGTAP